MRKWFATFASLLLIAALAVPAAAKPVSKSFRLAQTAKVGTAQITAGEYRLFIDGDQVTIQKGKEVVAKATARWEQRESKYQYDSYVIDRNGHLEEVRFAGDNRVLVLLNR
jgi:hypothetical protein